MSGLREWIVNRATDLADGGSVCLNGHEYSDIVGMSPYDVYNLPYDIGVKVWESLGGLIAWLINLFVPNNAVSFALIFVVADQTAHRCQRIIFKQQPTCFIQLICLQQPNDFRNGGVDGTSLLTLRYFTTQTAIGFVHYM